MGGSSSDQVIGYRYFMGLHMAVAHGPITSLNRVYVDKRAINDGGTLPITANDSFILNSPNKFGGDEKEGGIFGTLDFEFGEFSQNINSYLSTVYGNQTSAFRGVSCAVFRVAQQNLLPPGVSIGNYSSSSGGGYIAAMSPYPKPWAFDVTDIPGGSFNPTKQVINVSGANGGHIIYEALTDSDWGLGISTADMDLPSFTAVTDTLFDENFSLSMIYSTQSTMEEFIQEILDHINAVFYIDRQTGKFVLKLIRDDYDIGTLPVFDETNIASLINFERPAYAEMVNEIIIKYRLQGSFNDKAITLQDLSSVEAQGGIISQTRVLAGLDNDLVAAQVAQRELKQASSPLARVKFVANREAWDIVPGDAIKFSWAALGIEQIVLRVVDVNYGTLEDGLVQLDTVEDIFGLPLTSYFEPSDSDWADEVGPAQPVPAFYNVEVPFFVIETTFLQEFINALVDESALLESVAQFPPNATLGIEQWTRQDTDDYAFNSNGELAPSAELLNNIDEQVKTTIQIKNFTGGIGQVVIGGYAYLNDEVLRVDAVDTIANTIDIGRGYMDSLPLSHSADDIVYFADSNNAVSTTIYEETDEVDVKILTRTSIDLLSLDLAVEDTVTMVARRIRPYNGAQIRINGDYYPTEVLGFASIVVTWTYQDRTIQTVVDGEDWYEVSAGTPEAGTTYTVRYYNNDTTALLFTDSGITGTSSSFLSPTPEGVPVNLRVEMESFRDGYQSLTTFTHIFSFTTAANGRLIESGDARLTEGNEARVTEA